jgi:hypothetical protein
MKVGKQLIKKIKIKKEEPKKNKKKWETYYIIFATCLTVLLN